MSETTTNKIKIKKKGKTHRLHAAFKLNIQSDTFETLAHSKQTLLVRLGIGFKLNALLGAILYIYLDLEAAQEDTGLLPR